MDASEQSYAIRTKGLTKTFRSLTAVDGIDLSVRKGELFALLGHNGAGKTTTINMLSCLLTPTKGTATVMGHDVVREKNAVKKRINVSPQETAVASHLNVLENLTLMGRVYGLGKTQTSQKAHELIEWMGLRERIKDRVGKLSGGMQRRLSIAMALITDPDVLFLDEPTLGLDPQARRELWRKIESLKGDKTIILTTHYLEEADALSDRIAIIKSGTIVALGTPDELKHDLSGMQRMRVLGRGFTDAAIARIRDLHEHTKPVNGGIQIMAEKLNFDAIVDTLRSSGVAIEWLTMEEPSLDDVYLRFTCEEGQG